MPFLYAVSTLIWALVAFFSVYAFIAVAIGIAVLLFISMLWAYKRILGIGPRDFAEVAGDAWMQTSAKQKLYGLLFACFILVVIGLKNIATYYQSSLLGLIVVFLQVVIFTLIGFIALQRLYNFESDFVAGQFKFFARVTSFGLWSWSAGAVITICLSLYETIFVIFSFVPSSLKIPPGLLWRQLDMLAINNFLLYLSLDFVISVSSGVLSLVYLKIFLAELRNRKNLQ